MIDCFRKVGVDEISLSDTTGMATPWQGHEYCSRVKGEFPGLAINLHFHNTRGMGLANVVAGMMAGIDRYDACFARLGGCPFAPGASGNIATEDLVHMCHEMGISTGVDLDSIMALGRRVQEMVGHETASVVLKAGESSDLAQHRQIREAGWDHRLHRADDQPRQDSRRQRDLRDQGEGRGHIFSPHPRSKETTFETVRLMREALTAEDAPEDIVQYLRDVNIAISQTLTSRANLVIATGGQGLVRSAYSSGTPAYGVGAGNSTMVIDETADRNIEECAHNTMLSKTSDFGSGCSADGNLVVHEKVWERLKAQLVKEGGYLLAAGQQEAVRKAVWDEEKHRLPETVAVASQIIAKAADFEISSDRESLIAMGDGIGPEYFFCREKLTTLLAMFKYQGEFENAIRAIQGIYDIGGKGPSCGIYSFDDEHINRLALAAPVSRIMVRQPQSKANAGSFTNGMPMTSSLGCGT